MTRLSKLLPLPVVWIFPAVLTPGGGIVRGRIFKTDPDRGSRVLMRNLRSIVGARELPGGQVTLAILGRTFTVQADDEGFFTLELSGKDGALPLGTHEMKAFHEDRPTGAGRVAVIPAEGLSVVSDFDDTIAVTHVTRKRRMLATALLRDHSRHPAVPGMAALYRSLARQPGCAFHYLSGTPVGLFRRTERFLERHGFPPGAVILRHIQTAPLDALAYKPALIESLARGLPDHRLVLVGDSGEKDPEIYARVRADLGDRVRATLIRLVGGARRDDPRFDGAFAFEHATEAAAELARLGIIEPDVVAEVAAAGTPS